MVSTELEEGVSQVIADLALIDLADVTANAHLSEDLQLDSLDMAELAIKLEETFLGGEPLITAEYAAGWSKVSDVLETVAALQLKPAKKEARRA